MHEWSNVKVNGLHRENAKYELILKTNLSLPRNPENQEIQFTCRQPTFVSCQENEFTVFIWRLYHIQRKPFVCRMHLAQSSQTEMWSPTFVSHCRESAPMGRQSLCAKFRGPCVCTLCSM